jgi:hypothetical protein
MAVDATAVSPTSVPTAEPGSATTATNKAPTTAWHNALANAGPPAGTAHNNIVSLGSGGNTSL